MSPPDTSAELIREVERLLALPSVSRESEGVYANETQLKLLRKRLRTSRGQQPAGVGKFVADFASSGSKILRLVELLEVGGSD